MISTLDPRYKFLLRDYVNATIGFQKLSKLMKKKDTSLKRMLGPSGNPAAENLFAMTRLLQRQAVRSYIEGGE